MTLLRLSIRHGWEDKYPALWLENGTKAEKTKRRFEVQYNASVFAILCEELLRESGVETAVFQQGNILAAWYYAQSPGAHDPAALRRVYHGGYGDAQAFRRQCGSVQ